MTQLTTLPATASTKDILAVIHQDGAVVMRDLIASSEVDRVLDETRPYIDATRTGADEFTGFKTTRTGALVARSPACRELILNDSVLEAARQFLAPYRPLRSHRLRPFAWRERRCVVAERVAPERVAEQILHLG